MNTEARVVEFVKSELWELNKEISLNTRLLEDFGLDGDDACEFFEKYAEKFRVNLSDMKWNEHFGPEGFQSFRFFLSFHR